MTAKQGKSGVIDVKALLEGETDYLRAMVRAVVEATLEAEMTAALGAEKGERTEGRLGYSAGYYSRLLMTRVGVLELRVPQVKFTESFGAMGLRTETPEQLRTAIRTAFMAGGPVVIEVLVPERNPSPWPWIQLPTASGKGAGPLWRAEWSRVQTRAKKPWCAFNACDSVTIVPEIGGTCRRRARIGGSRRSWPLTSLVTPGSSTSTRRARSRGSRGSGAS